MKDRLESLRRVVAYGMDHGKRNLIVDLDLIVHLFARADAMEFLDELAAKKTDELMERLDCTETLLAREIVAKLLFRARDVEEHRDLLRAFVEEWVSKGYPALANSHQQALDVLAGNQPA
ncbi:MAG: hypothetical protein KGL39_10610 [Patescibacteria group bacterium]|nr:hypothetical protein [Patescibacteria group bacterium]